MMEIVDIVLAANHRYARGLEATIVSMVNAASDKSRLRFHVFDDGLHDSDKERLISLLARFGYTEDIDFKLPNVKPLLERFLSYNGSQTAYLRLLFPELLSGLDWVLWTDVDTLWFRDPILFWAERDESKSVLWARDIRSTRISAKKAAKWRPDRDVMRYACSGVLLMNLKRMRENGFVDKALAFGKKWGACLLYADQDVLNEICYDDSKFVDEYWDCMYPISNVANGVVIHFNGIGPYFSGESKRWFFPLFEIWFRYYAEIIEGCQGLNVASWWKRALYDLTALFYPFHRIISFFTDPIHPWVSDFIQRLIFFSWLRRRKLWK